VVNGVIVHATGMNLMKQLLAFGTICTALALSSTAFSQSNPVRLGARAVIGFNQLAPPEDPAGEPTLLSGAGFSGLGIGGGLSAQIQLAQASFGDVYLEIDALYVVHSADGSASSPATQQSRKIEFKANTVHAPALIGIAQRRGRMTYRFAMGPELLLGMGTSSTVTEENLPGDPQPLLTTPVTHVGITGLIGFDYALTSDWVLPIEIRVTWDPSIGTSTVDRFDNYRDPNNPGSYQVAFNWFVSAVIGFDRLIEW